MFSYLQHQKNNRSKKKRQIRLHQITKNRLCFKEHHQESEKTSDRMGKKCFQIVYWQSYTDLYPKYVENLFTTQQ